MNLKSFIIVDKLFNLRTAQIKNSGHPHEVKKICRSQFLELSETRSGLPIASVISSYIVVG